jgi:hypothetical protein
LAAVAVAFEDAAPGSLPWSPFGAPLAHALSRRTLDGIRRYTSVGLVSTIIAGRGMWDRWDTEHGNEPFHE